MRGCFHCSDNFWSYKTDLVFDQHKDSYTCEVNAGKRKCFHISGKKTKKFQYPRVPGPPAGFYLLLLSLAPIMKVSTKKINFRSIHVGLSSWKSYEGKNVTLPVLHIDILVKLKLQIYITWKSDTELYVIPALSTHPWCHTRNSGQEVESWKLWVGLLYQPCIL